LQSTISLLGIGYIKRKQNHYSKEPLAHPCLVQHYSQQPRYEISWDVHWWINKENAEHIQNGIIFTH
jgi:hypothetical protein